MTKAPTLYGPTGHVLPTVRMGYDVNSREQRRRRRGGSIEIGAERGARGVLDPWQALTNTQLLRDLYRNYSQAKSLLTQLVLHVVGCGNEVLFNTDDADWNLAAAYWYNEEWAAACDGRDDRWLHDLNAAVLASVVREHDCVMWFDRAGVFQPGGLFFWETDQVASLRKKDFDEHAADIARAVGWTGRADQLQQDEGLVLSPVGKTLGYVVHGGRGKTELKWDEATVLPRGPATLVKKPWRLNQKRGTSELLTAAASLVDNYELLQYELQAAKAGATQAVKFKVADAHRRAIARATGSDGQSSDPEVTDSARSAFDPYTNYEKLFPGSYEYLEPDEDVEILENKRPAAQLADFIDHQTLAAGGSLGLPRFYSLMKADASFSATRGEMNLGDVTFESWQSWLERYVLRWQCDLAIPFAMATGQLPQNDQWRQRRSFDHPKQKALDENKQAQADAVSLALGTKSYEDIYGADWQQRLKKAGDQKAYAREVGARDETPVTPAPAPTTEEDDKENA